MHIADDSDPVLLRCTSVRAVNPECASPCDVEGFLHAEITLRWQTSTETQKCLLDITICITCIEA